MNVPDDLYYAESHEWVRVEGENAGEQVEHEVPVARRVEQGADRGREQAKAPRVMTPIATSRLVMRVEMRSRTS